MRQHSASAVSAGHSGLADAAVEFDQQVGSWVADGDDRLGGGAALAGDSVVVYLQLRPRRASSRRCLAALVALAAEHGAVEVSLAGLSKDDRVVRITLGVDLGSRAEVARFSDQAQAAYGFVSAVFTVLYDHLPVYVAEPSGAERDAAAALVATAAATPVALLASAQTSAAPATRVTIPRLTALTGRQPAGRHPAHQAVFELAGTTSSKSA